MPAMKPTVLLLCTLFCSTTAYADHHARHTGADFQIDYERFRSNFVGAADSQRSDLRQDACLRRALSVLAAFVTGRDLHAVRVQRVGEPVSPVAPQWSVSGHEGAALVSMRWTF